MAGRFCLLTMALCTIAHVASFNFVARSPLHVRSISRAPRRQAPTLRVDTKFDTQVSLPKQRFGGPRSGIRQYRAPVAITSLFLAVLVATGVVSPAMAVPDPAAALATVTASSSVGADALSLLDRTLGVGFVQAFSLIFISEIGDKTFFIAALLSAKFSRVISFVGSVGALVVMTAISVGLGQLFHAVPSGFTNGLPIDDYLACAAFAYFGYRTLLEAYQMEDDDKGGELEDAEEALKVLSEEDSEVAGAGEAATVLDRLRQSGAVALVAQTFALVFAAEFGDRSFLSTIALSAAANPVSVFTGAVVAHTVATAGAVAGGAILSEYISEKVIGYIGGSLFIVFAVTTLLGFF